jgi:signal transduction histidine kinase
MHSAALEKVESQMRRQAALLALARLDKSHLSAALREITEIDARALGVERVSVWRFTADRAAIRCEDLFRFSSGCHETGLILLSRDYPSYFRALEESYTIAAHDAQCDPRTMEFLSAYLVPNGITSMMDAPVWSGGRVVGIVCHEHTGPPRVWAPEEQEFAGAAANMVSLAFEIAERWEAERSTRLLSQVNPLLRAVLDQMPAGFVLAEAPSGRVLLVNRAAERIWRRSTLLGEDGGPFSLANVGHLSGAPYGRCQLPLERAVVAGETVLGEEMRIRRGDGSWGIVSVNAAPVRNELGSIAAAVAIVEDFTDRRKLEAERAQDAYRERFVGILGHDLRGPLAAATMAAQVLLRAEGPCPGHEHAARLIVASCGRMERMIHDLLDFARSRHGGGIQIAPRPMDLLAVCRSIVDETQAAAPGRSLVLHASADCHGEWDPERLAQVVSNLLGNAVQYGANSPIAIRLSGSGGEVVLEMHNRGPPIPAEFLPRVFDPFRSAQEGNRQARAPGSVGLGLYIAREIVRAHGGTIEARSSQEEGTTFTVRLPRHGHAELRQEA